MRHANRLTRRQLITALGLGIAGRALGFNPAFPRCAHANGAVPVYLTFDDGVETEGAEGKKGPTLDVLDILDEHGIRATFFLHGRNTGPAEGHILARMIQTGHRLGNHLFQQGGVTVNDRATPSYMAHEYLATETRLREVLQPFPDALAIYTGPDHPHLFRRPGGGYDNAHGNLFLLPDAGYWDVFATDPLLAPYRDRLDWLRGVYDYSGWHINPLPLWAQVESPEDLVFHTLYGTYGLTTYLHPLPDQDPQATTRAALDGLIILLHDPDRRVVEALPLLIYELKQLGAEFFVLPRPADRPNAYTVGINRPLEIAYRPTPPLDSSELP